MILTVDVGNTNIVLSVYDQEQRLFTSRMATQASKMEDEYAVDMMNLFRLYGCESASFEGAILSTVVPQLVGVLRRAIDRVCSCRVYVVSSGIKTGLNIKLDNPGVVGADLVCGAVAHALYHFRSGHCHDHFCAGCKRCVSGGLYFPRRAGISACAFYSHCTVAPH